MKKLRLAVLAVAILLPVASGFAQALRSTQAQAVDAIAAIVNNDVITQRELHMRIAMITHRLEQQKAPVPPFNILHDQVLNEMVLERIQLERARDDGIYISDADVHNMIERLAQANQMTPEMYRERIQQAGVPWQIFLRDVRTDLTLSRLREQEVDSKVSVSDADVANYLATQRGPNEKLSLDLHLQHILFKVPADATQEQLAEVQAKAEAVLKQAEAGAKFTSLAKSNSQANDASKGGDMAFQPQSQLPAEWVSAASKLRPGQVSPNLIRTSDGFEIVRLVDRRVNQNASSDAGAQLTQTHVRHILLRIGNGMSEPEAQQKLMEIRQKILAGGDFAQFARSYSQDGSASHGGDLGWISPGETIPEFEHAMNELQDGEISGPVRSEYGFHLIQVLGRRQAQGSVDQQMSTIRQAIGQRKAERAYTDWLRQLRDTAYVRYFTSVND